MKLMKGLASVVCLCLVQLFQHGVFAAKVLLVPANINSHVIYFGQLGVAIATQGDDVTMLLPSNAKVPPSLSNTRLKIEQYQVTEKASLVNSPVFSDLVLTSAMSQSILGKMDAMAKIEKLVSRSMANDCEHRMRADVMQRTREAAYDLMIVDPADLSCGTIFPYALDIPYGLFSTPFLTAYLYRCPALPSMNHGLVADIFGGLHFWHRLTNVALDFLMIALYNKNTTFLEMHAPHRPILTTAQLSSKASLWFTLDTLAFNYPGPSMPNMVSVGDVMARPAKPLPGDLQAFMDSANEGVILVSQGSYLNHVPENVLHKLCGAFQKIPFKILWKIKAIDGCNVDPEKVKVVQWMPQNDLLAHPNLKVFFTHGGINSAFESIYHAKPMLVMPFSLDQPMNAALVEDRKFGLRLTLSSFGEDELVEKILRLFDDQEILQSLRHASRIIQNMPETAGQRASFWINHVVQNGDEHLRTGAFDLNLAQFYMFDVFTFFILVILIVFLVAVICCRCVGRKLRKFCCKEKVKVKTN